MQETLRGVDPERKRPGAKVVRHLVRILGVLRNVGEVGVGEYSRRGGGAPCWAWIYITLHIGSYIPLAWRLFLTHVIIVLVWIPGGFERVRKVGLNPLEELDDSKSPLPEVGCDSPMTRGKQRELGRKHRIRDE